MRLPKVKEGLFDHIKAVNVRGSFDVNKLAKKYNVPYKLFKKLNPDLRRRWIKNRKLRVFIPTKELTHYASLMSEYKSRYVASNELETSYYRVKRGDNLSTIAKRLSISLSDLKRLNRIKGSHIFVGQKLIVSKSRVPSSVYKVRKGDSLSEIARRFGTTISTLRNTNGLKTSNIYVGQRLRIHAQILKKYSVKRGDNLSTLARRFGVNLSQLKKVNNLKSSRLYIGQSILIPNNG